MESIYHFKSLQPAHFFTFPNHWAVTPRPCRWKQEIDALTLCASGGFACLPRLPGSCIKSACGNSAALPRVSQVSVFVCQPVRKDFLDCCCTNILLVFVPSVPLASRWLPTAASPPTLSNWILPAGTVRARFQRELDDNSWMAHTLWSIKGKGCWVSATETTARRKYVEKIACFLSQLA